MNIVFDFGGVVFRWNPLRFLPRVLPHRAPDEAAAQALVRAFFQDYGGDWGAFDRGTVEPDALVARIAARTGLAADEVQRVVDGVPDELAPLPETVALIERLHERGHRLFYLSNMPAPYAAHLLASHAFLGAFDDGVFSSAVKAIKPEPEIFALAVERFGVPPGDLLFIDDHPANVAAARSLGWQAVQFTDAPALTLALAERGAL